MPWQLIYTSAPRGLHSGQSGFCTVAQSADLREALAQRLEQISSYHYLKPNEAALNNRNPTICAFRILDLRGAKYHVLTRIQPCGLDFTSRTNHLAHHLVFQDRDLAQLPSPASILRYWDGWLGAWQEEPRLLRDLSPEAFGAAAKICLPAQTWLRVTGDAGKAAGLLDDECRGCYLVCPAGGEAPVLEMFCETLQLLNPNGQYPLRPWRHTFTTFFQAEDNPADFQWRACQQGTPGYKQAIQSSARILPLASVRVPGNSLVTLAREGPSASAPQPVESPPSALGGHRPEDKRPPATGLGSTPNLPPKSSPRPSNGILSLAYSAVKQRQARIQRWFLTQSAASRVSLGVFAAVLLGLLAIVHWGCKRHAMSDDGPAVPPAPASGGPAPRAGNPGGPGTGQTAPPEPIRPAMEPVDPKQWAWLLDGGPTFVFATPDFAHFELPMSSIGPFQRLIRRFDRIDVLPANIHLFVNTDLWASPKPGLPMSVNPRGSPEFSAQATNGPAVCFYYTNWSTTNRESDPEYTNWVSTNKLPVLVTTTFATPPKAFSIQFGDASSNGCFRLLIVNESAPPPPVLLPASLLKAGFEDSLIREFTFLQGQRLQFDPSKGSLFISNLGQSQHRVEMFRFDPKNNSP